MKLSNVFAKLTAGSKATVLGGLVMAGTALTVASPAASAQVAFGVEVGGPRYYAPEPRPVYVQPGYAAYGYDSDQRAYWQARRAQEWREQQFREQQWREHQWREHEEREHRQDFDRNRRGYDRDGWR